MYLEWYWEFVARAAIVFIVAAPLLFVLNVLYKLVVCGIREWWESRY